MTAHEFDSRFESGEDVSDHVDWSRKSRPNVGTKRVNVDFPARVIAERLG